MPTTQQAPMEQVQRTRDGLGLLISYAAIIRAWVPADDAEAGFDWFDQRPESGKPVEIPSKTDASSSSIGTEATENTTPGKTAAEKCLAKRIGLSFSRTTLERMNPPTTTSCLGKSLAQGSVTGALHQLSAPCSPRRPRSPTPVRALTVHDTPGAKAIF